MPAICTAVGAVGSPMTVGRFRDAGVQASPGTGSGCTGIAGGVETNGQTTKEWTHKALQP